VFRQCAANLSWVQVICASGIETVIDSELLSAAAPDRARYSAGPISEPEPASAMLIGLGNLILGDEGVGVHAMRRLEAEYAFQPTVELVDGGTSGLDLLPLLKDQRRLLLIDALASDAAPGTTRVIRNHEIRTALTEKVSLHHLGIADLLALAELLDYAPAEIVLIGIVPERMEMELALSGCLRQRMPKIIETAIGILAEWGIASSRRSAPLHAPLTATAA
jgi:hydrogenase maturation protease